MNTLEDLDILRALPDPIGFRAAMPDHTFTDSNGTGMCDTCGQTEADHTQSNSIGTMFGHSTIFNTWYEVDSWFEGNFMERVAPGSAADTIANDPEPAVLFNHGRDASVGQKPLGMHEDLREDQVGVYYQVPLLDTSYNRDILPGLKAGAYGSSFMFRVQADSWDDEPATSDSNPKGIPERTITRFRLFEHGPVTFPANPAATSGARSVTDDYYESLRTANPDAFEALAARARQLRTPKPSGAEGAPGEPVANPTDFARDRALKLARRRK